MSSLVASIKILFTADTFGLKLAFGAFATGFGGAGCEEGTFPPCINAAICCLNCASCCCNCSTSSLLGASIVLGEALVCGCAILIVKTSSEIVGFVVKRISCCVWFKASTKRYKKAASTSSLNCKKRSLRPTASPLCLATRRSLANSSHSSTNRLASFPILKSCCKLSNASSAFCACKSATKSIIKSSVRLPDT